MFNHTSENYATEIVIDKQKIKTMKVNQRKVLELVQKEMHKKVNIYFLNVLLYDMNK